MQLSYDSLILSASGWRKVFAASGNEEDTKADIGTTNKQLAALMAETFADFVTKKTGKKSPVIVVGTDTRPTGTQIVAAVLCVLCEKGISVRFLGVSAAPEIMAFSRTADAFLYISASHNPIGHNGVKFGLHEGGVVNASDANILAADFKERCSKNDACEHAEKLIELGRKKSVQVYEASSEWKNQALDFYETFTREVITGETESAKQEVFFAAIRDSVCDSPVSVVCDMNGSARSRSIDRRFLAKLGIGFFALHDEPGRIVHAIIPEPENLVHCAHFMTDLQKGTSADFAGKHPEAVIGFMPDCDGDRGNIVYWDKKNGTAEIVRAQEVFALCVLAETAYLAYCGTIKKAAVAINDPTSMRIDDIARAFGVSVFRAEVGESNVVNLARQLRTDGYTVRILGEGSNGGNITHPAAVRDPLNTIFALLKLLTVRGIPAQGKNLAVKGLFHLWCEASGQEKNYHSDFTLRDIIATLPSYTTTGVSENRALAPVKSADHAALKRAYQTIFLREWQTKKSKLAADYGITQWDAIAYNGTKETRNIADFGVSQKGGLKILFKDTDGKNLAYIWMRGSATEPVFRILCDVKGANSATEAQLLEWHTAMLLEADTMVCT